MPWFGDGDEVQVILELKAVKELEPSATAASVLILGRTCRDLFTGIFSSREQRHEYITDGRGAILKYGGIWLGIEEERRLVRTIDGIYPFSITTK